MCGGEELNGSWHRLAPWFVPRREAGSFIHHCFCNISALQMWWFQGFINRFFKKGLSTLNISAPLIFVIKYSHKRRPSLMIPWCWCWINASNIVTFLDSSIYRAKVQLCKRENNSVFLFPAKSLIHQVTGLLKSGSAVNFFYWLCIQQAFSSSTRGGFMVSLWLHLQSIRFDDLPHEIPLASSPLVAQSCK